MPTSKDIPNRDPSLNPVRLCYQTIEFGNTDIHIRTLRDNQQFSDPLGEAAALGISSAQWPLFGIVWPSSEILAHEINAKEIKGKRILEVGCGIGLSSLLLNERFADITATDIHPEAGGFLYENVKLNNGIAIPFLRTDWKDPCNGLGTFDLIIGSDILYEKDHIELLSGFINEHANQHCEVIMVDPGRSNHASFSKKMVALGFSHSQHASEHLDKISRAFKGQVLSYLRN